MGVKYCDSSQWPLIIFYTICFREVVQRLSEVNKNNYTHVDKQLMSLLIHLLPTFHLSPALHSNSTLLVFHPRSSLLM